MPRISLVVWAGAGALMSGMSVFFSPLYPTLGLIASLGAIAGGRFALERDRADQAGHDKIISQRLMVQTLLSLTEVRDIETGRHSRRTQEYARVLATQLARHPDFRAVPHARAHRTAREPRAAARHRQGRRARPAPEQGRHADRRRNDRDAETSRAWPRRHRARRTRCRFVRRYDSRDGQGDRVHASREVGRHRLSPGPERTGDSDRRPADRARRRLRRRDHPPRVSRSHVARRGGQVHRRRARARTSIPRSSMPSSRCRRPSVASLRSANKNRKSACSSGQMPNGRSNVLSIERHESSI